MQRAVHTILSLNPHLVLMQCNTNYTASPENFDHIHLNVLKTYAAMFPDVVLGLSDHTHGHATVLGAVTMGARVIEKHFTDDNAPRRSGPQICDEPAHLGGDGREHAPARARPGLPGQVCGGERDRIR